MPADSRATTWRSRVNIACDRFGRIFSTVPTTTTGKIALAKSILEG